MTREERIAENADRDIRHAIGHRQTVADQREAVELDVLAMRRNMRRDNRNSPMPMA